jgi:DNA topoisomerase-3
MIKNYDFDYPQCRANFTVTCVAGHVLQHEFAWSHRKWQSCDPFELFDAPIDVEVAPDKKAIVDNLLSEARKAQQLMIWTDCDREGENIGAEIVKVCRKSKPNIVVKRARFSAIIAQ